MEGARVRSLRHTPGLDGFRGLAVLFVVALHAFSVLAPQVTQRVPNGFLGVDLFFVLSGFLITALLLSEHDRHGRLSFGRFYRRRALRLLPALFVLLVVHVIYTIVVSNSLAEERDRVLATVFYVLNWAQLNGLEGQELGHLWSLSIEEQFYLAWPLILLGLLALAAWTRRIGVVIGTLIVLILGVVVMRIWMLDNFPHAFQVYSRTDARADSLLIGALAAVLWTRYRLPARVLALAASVALVFIFVVVLRPLGPVHPFFYRGGFTLIALASAIVILAVVESGWWANHVFRFRPLCAIGIVSYGLYLWHVPVFLVVGRNLTEWPTMARVALGVGIAAAITAASWFLVERPFLRWKERLERDRATRIDTDAADAQPTAHLDDQTGSVAPAVDAAVR